MNALGILLIACLTLSGTHGEHQRRVRRNAELPTEELLCASHCQVKYSRRCLTPPANCGACLKGFTARDSLCLRKDPVVVAMPTVKRIKNEDAGGGGKPIPETEEDQIDSIAQQLQNKDNAADGTRPILYPQRYPENVLDSILAREELYRHLQDDRSRHRTDNDILTDYRDYPGLELYKGAPYPKLPRLNEEYGDNDNKNSDEEELFNPNINEDVLEPDKNDVVDAEIEKEIEQEIEEAEAEKVKKAGELDLLMEGEQDQLHPKSLAMINKKGDVELGVSNMADIYFLAVAGKEGGTNLQEADPVEEPHAARISGKPDGNTAESNSSLTSAWFLAVVVGCSVAGLVGLVVAGFCWFSTGRTRGGAGSQ